MNRYQFKLLDKKSQLKAIRIKGRLLHKRLNGKYDVSLYGMKSFYIEVWYDAVRRNFHDMVTFKDRSLLAYQFNISNE